MAAGRRVSDPDLPDIDDRLAEPGTRYEVWDGELVYVSPADPPHGSRHVQLAAVVEAHADPAFEVAAEMLTRTSRTDDIAPDVSVYPEAPDPVTGRRQLEQLAFEIVSTQSLSRAGLKAGKLAKRGVRRVFAIDVERTRALEWSKRKKAWVELDAAGHITDPALAVAIPIHAIIHAARTDDAVARALIARRNPVIETIRKKDRRTSRARGKAEGKREGLLEGKREGHLEGKREGRAEGKREALLELLASRGIALDDVARDRIDRERDPEQLGRWIRRTAAATTLGDVLGDDRDPPERG
jgi:Uma2 family endonuclease